MKRIVVSGGRDYDDFAMVVDTLSFISPTEVYVGDCPTGVDSYVREWCEYNCIKHVVFQADWAQHDKAAGPIRNGEMLKSATREAILIAFPGGKGTADCVKQAINMNFIVLKVQR